MIVYIPYFNHS